MRIAYKNIVDEASAITAYSELSSYPVENVQDQRLSNRWISDSTTSQNVVLTFPTFPEFPDNATQTSYIQTAWSTVDSWAATRATLSVTNYTGILTVTATSNTSAYITRSGLTITAGSTITVRARSQLSSTLTILNSAGSTLATLIGLTSTFSMLTGTTATAATQLNVYSNNSTTGIALEIDKIYTGTGLYTSVLTDYSGNGNHGTVYGATPGADGSLSFDKTNDYVRNTTIPPPPTNYSMSVWFKATVNVTDTQRIFAISTDKGLTGFFISGSQLRADSRNSASGQIAATITPVISANVEYHAVLVRDGSNIRLYLNGVLGGSNTGADAVFSSVSYVDIGAAGLSTYFGGTIRSPRIYNRALGAQEIKSLYDEEAFASEYLGLVGDWTLDKNYRVNTAAILGHNLHSGTTVSVQANNSDEWSDPPFSTTFSFIASDATILKYLSSTYNYKYWRFTFSGQGDIEVGRLWLGEYLQINPASSLDFSVSKKTDDTVVYGKGRQKYASIGNKWRRIELRDRKSTRLNSSH